VGTLIRSHSNWQMTAARKLALAEGQKHQLLEIGAGRPCYLYKPNK
jgi:hypothetical protein